MDYRDKLILAPMVRIGTLPLRLLALKYGADIVYTEELIDLKLLRTERVENVALGTVDFVDQSDGTVVFRTCEQERDRVVLQLGTADADRAAEVLRKVGRDIAAIDVNMGCPKSFSLKGGMGAALLKKPETVRQILTRLVKESPVPVTCKIRILPDAEELVALVKVIRDSGVKALAVHGRFVQERPRDKNHNDVIRQIVQAFPDLPIIANGGSGEISCFSDIGAFKESTGASSVMLARVAQWNPSIFRPEGKLGRQEVVRDYLRLCIRFGHCAVNAKYCIQSMIQEAQGTTDWGRALLQASTMEEICAVFEMEEELAEFRREVSAKKESVSAARSASPELKRPLLLLWSRRRGLPQPKYSVEVRSRIFQATVHVEGVGYRSSPGEKNRRYAEQAAALVWQKHNGVTPTDVFQHSRSSSVTLAKDDAG
ncbi:unnamed protein product [Cyprideis torosa]|uniref:DUS-like FMN-binding domain-containing protein n=1 Tax=Cyprideis torosa TaxID=163714 RepID=A0A7R8ZNN9_9CRUS|nr:unnamed protein product [Cyprideis torosa]CAG0888168.1 unnamed protein product [Cyprideis torosa]